MLRDESGFDLKGFCEKCHVADIGKFLSSCEMLYTVLEEANKNINLTRISGPGDYWNKHIADSIASALFFNELHSEKLYAADIGCGAGFPSIPLAMAFPNLTITAIDSTGKKTAFVESVKAGLDIKNLRVVNGRARELAASGRFDKTFDIVTARAVSEAGNIFDEVRPMIKGSSRIILYKTPERAVSEKAEVEKISTRFGVKWSLTDVFELPGGNGSRQFLYSNPQAKRDSR